MKKTKKMEQAYRKFMDNQTHLSESTHKDQSIILENFPPIDKLNAAYFKALIEEEKYSAFTLWKRYGLAKRVLTFHKIEHDLGTLKLPSLARKEPVTVEDLYTADELKGMFAACKNSRDRAMLEMLYESACRASELLSLKIENISFGDGPNEYTITISGKTGTRTIPMGHSITALKAWLNVHPFKEKRKGPVFVMTNGNIRQMTRSNLYATVKFALKDAGITGKKKIVHMFRHTRITEFVRHGVRGQTLHKLVGWTKKSNMEAIYVHLDTTDVENEVAKKIYGKQVIEKRGQLVETKMCPSCSQDMIDMGAKFCPVCGYPLTKNSVNDAEKRTDNLEARIASLESLVKQVATGELSPEWIAPEIYEKATSEEAKVLKETFTEVVSTPEGRAGLEREDAEIKEFKEELKQYLKKNGLTIKKKEKPKTKKRRKKERK